MTDVPPETTQITLTRSEALVLDSWLHNHEAADTTPGDDAERAALWSLAALLEKELAETFRPDYAKLIEAAREDVRRAYGIGTIPPDSPPDP